MARGRILALGAVWLAGSAFGGIPAAEGRQVGEAARTADAELSGALEAAFRAPAEFRDDLGAYRSPLVRGDGRVVGDAAEWSARRGEILAQWHGLMGAWPARIEHPRLEVVGTERGEGYEVRAVRVEVASGHAWPGYLLVPDGLEAPAPAVIVVFYEPETAIGRGTKPARDYARQLARRGFVALSLGISPYDITPGQNGYPAVQPLSFLAYAASNARGALADRPEVDAGRIGVMGHSYGGKWALFAAALDERFACGVWSDPGIVFDESRPNVNYWEPWYLGWEPGRTRRKGLLSAESPRTGAYKALVESGHDLTEILALVAPRPFLVSGGAEDPPERWRALNHVVAVNRILGFEHRVAMTDRPLHEPTAESNEVACRFLEWALKPGAAGPAVPPAP